MFKRWDEDNVDVLNDRYLASDRSDVPRDPHQRAEVKRQARVGRRQCRQGRARRQRVQGLQEALGEDGRDEVGHMHTSDSSSCNV